MAKVEIDFQGSVQTIECGDNETILNKALDSGIQLPFGCMSGSCTACMAQKVEGEVKMESDVALTDDDKATRKILTCQAIPASDVVKIKVD